MAYDIHVSIAAANAVAIQNYFNTHPDISPSRLIRRLLLEHIKAECPELLKVEDIQKPVRLDIDDYIETLKIAVETSPDKFINKDQAALLLHKKFGMELKTARRKLAALTDSMFRTHGIDWQGGKLIPFKPYFPPAASDKKAVVKK